MRSQIVIAAAAAVVSWYAMMAIHEAGHCLGAIAAGAMIERVVIPAIGFSRTDVSGGSHPVLVAWAGPVFGAFAPVLLLPLTRLSGSASSRIAQVAALGIRDRDVRRRALRLASHGTSSHVVQA